MGFKVSSSFLHYLTMGALGFRQVAAELEADGFHPVELERYCGSNKIWATKVKRLRLPDLLCVRTGLRAEVRAKSELKIRMSDAPSNPDRVWDAGLRNEDFVALIACPAEPGGPRPADHAVYFTVRDLRASVGDSRLGPPKSASEGAERDRTWPAVIPSRPGKVLSVSAEKLMVSMEGDGEPARRQTYTLNGKYPYVRPGDTFDAETTILAGAPRRLADLSVYRERAYQPLDHVSAANPVDRYAAVKALRFRADLHKKARPALEGVLEREREQRVALEAAGSAAALGSATGEDRLAATLWHGESVEMSMEAILILTELGTPFARDQLRAVASSGQFRGDERRQAALWGLGKAGLKAYADLLPHIADSEENAAYHAIAAFGPDTPSNVVRKLVAILVQGDPHSAPAASEALRVIGSEIVLSHLLEAVQSQTGNQEWVIATMGRLAPDLVRAQLAGRPNLFARLAPMLLLAPGANWLAHEEAKEDLIFLLKQDL